MANLHELMMRRIELQQELSRVQSQIERLEQIEYREWQRLRAAELGVTLNQRPGAVTILPSHIRMSDLVRGY